MKRKLKSLILIHLEIIYRHLLFEEGGEELWQWFDVFCYIDVHGNDECKVKICTIVSNQQTNKRHEI